MKAKLRTETRRPCVPLIWLLLCASSSLFAQGQSPGHLTHGLYWGSEPLMAPGTNTCLTSPGEVIDPSGDAVLPPQLATAPDLASGSVSLTGSALRLRARFYPGTFDAATTAVTFALDTDQNAVTGQPGLTASGSNADSSLGAEFLVSMGSVYGQRAVVSQFTGANSALKVVGFAPVTYNADGIDALVPMSLLGITGVKINFRLSAVSTLPSGSFSPVVDFMPDLNSVPGSTTCNVFASNLPPNVFSGGVVNASSYSETAISPGEIITVFGSTLGPKDLAGLVLTQDGLVANQLAGVRVLFDGTPGPMIYAQDGQVSVVAPYSIAGRRTTQVQIENNGRLSTAVTMRVAASAPGLFTLDASGVGPGAILNQDNSVNSAANPAANGSIVVLYGTGEGVTIPPGVDGKPAAVPLATPLLPITVLIGGQSAEILYAGAAPGLIAGVVQVNVRLPKEITPGPNVPVRLQVGDFTSAPGVTLAIQ